MAQKRLTFIPDVEALTVLGYSVEEDGQTLCGVGPARRLAKLVARAARDLDAVLTRSEWNAIADVMNGCADLYDYADSGIPALLMLRSNLEDSPEIGKKWKIKPADLIRKLDSLTPLHGEAIICAVRWALRHVGQWDHTKDDWWAVWFRAGKQKTTDTET